MTDEEIKEYRRLQAEGMRNVAIPFPTNEQVIIEREGDTMHANEETKKPRKKSLRLTKMQREYQQAIIVKYLMDGVLQPSTHLLDDVMKALYAARFELKDERSKSLRKIAVECLRRKRRVW